MRRLQLQRWRSQRRDFLEEEQEEQVVVCSLSFPAGLRGQSKRWRVFPALLGAGLDHVEEVEEGVLGELQRLELAVGERLLDLVK